MVPMKLRMALLWVLALVAGAGCGRPSPPAERSDAAEDAQPARFAAPAPTVPADAPGPPGPPLSVPLTFSTPVSGSYPISSGIPLPRAAVRSVAHLWLEDAGGRPVPAQFAPLSAWPDRSLKSVLVSIVASPAASTYTLRAGPGKPVTPTADPASGGDAPQAPKLTWSEERDRIIVTTGPTRLAIPTKRFGVFEQIWVDADQNGAFEDAEQLLSAPGDLFLINQDDGQEYRSSRDPRPRVKIEEAGPLRIVLSARGAMQAQSGATLTEFVVRLTACAGVETIQLDYTLVDPREEHDVDAKREGVALNVKGYGLRLPLKLDAPATGLFGGDPMQGHLAYGGPLVERQHLYQGGGFHYIDGKLRPFSFFYHGVAQGERAEGWVDASSQRAGLAAMVRHFWQQFPKELAIEQNTMIVYLHPPRANTDEGQELDPEPDPKRYTRRRTFYSPREGLAKTYQLLIHPHRGPGDAKALHALYETFQAMPRLISSPQWMSRSEAFGHLIETGHWSQGYDAHMMHDFYEPSIEAKRRGGGLAVLYGWRDYGDRLRPGWVDIWNGKRIPGFYNDTHVGARSFLAQYARTGDERWFELGEAATRHWMDIDVSHANRLGHWKRSGKYVGYGPGEAHMIKHEMVDHHCRNVHTGHAHISGLPDYYLLTGDARALEVLHEVGTWWANAVPDMYKVPTPKPHWAEAERDFAWPLFTLNEAYRATGEVKYLKAGAHLVQHLIGWWQQPADHYVNGTVVGRNDWRQGTGWWTMYPRQDNSPEPPKGKILFNGTNPWMAGPLISAVIQFHELDRDHHLVDDALTEEMLLQTMNYVVKYGWNADRGFFIYSEASRDIGGDMTLLAYPLAYLGQRVQAGGLEHPEWYDTASRWLPMAERAFRGWQSGAHGRTSSDGFYGYEFVHPPEFFTLMAEPEPGPR